MDVVGGFIERAQLLIETHVSDSVSVPVFVGMTVSSLVAGLGLAVLGARLARGSLTLGFSLLGGVVGVVLGQLTGVPLAVSGLLGAGIMGVVGYALHRFWVGVVTAVVMVLAVNATYGAHTLGQQVGDYVYNHSMPDVVAPSVGGFRVPDPDQQAAALNPEFTRWVRGLGEYCYAHDRPGTRRLLLGSACGGLFGLLMGLLAVRLTLVTMTSLIGTAMFSFGALSAVRFWQHDLYQSGLAHPQWLGTAAGVFLLGSLVLQSLLTRGQRNSRDTSE